MVSAHFFRNPTLDSLVLVLQEEEYSWYLKQQEQIRYSNPKGYARLTKRNHAELSQYSNDSVKDRDQEVTTYPFKSPLKHEEHLNPVISFSPKVKRKKIVTQSKTKKELPIHIKLPRGSNADPKQWLQWKDHSCRLDAFFTLVVFCILNDQRFNVDMITNFQDQELKNTFALILKADSVKYIQEKVDSFAMYRNLHANEKVGESHSIVRLFTLFNKMNEFLTSLEDQINCKCGLDKRVFTLGPLLSITHQNLSDSKGKLSDAIKSKFKNYKSQCSKCALSLVTERNITTYPVFLFIIVEICDEYNNLSSRKNFQDFTSIKLSNYFKINSKKYNLDSVCYFQDFHYNIHVKGSDHPNILGLNSNKWMFHDGLLNQGKIVESTPMFEFLMKTEEKLPYIMLYKLNC